MLSLFLERHIILWATMLPSPNEAIERDVVCLRLAFTIGLNRDRQNQSESVDSLCNSSKSSACW